MVRTVLRSAAVLLFFALAIVASASRSQADPLTITAGEAAHRFDVELAATPKDRSVGLMYRQALADGAGMLFDFGSEQPVSMWMKNTYIPLDMIFIRADGTIRRIEENTIPFSLDTIASGGPVRYVLEVNGGTARRLGLKPGNKVSHSSIQ